MLKIYEIDGKLWQFEEGEQPAGAREYRQKAVKPPEDKAVKPANKARKAERAPADKAAGPIARKAAVK